jgi:hypothetical protein
MVARMRSGLTAILMMLALGLTPSAGAAALRVVDASVVEAQAGAATLADDAASPPQLWRCVMYDVVQGTATWPGDFNLRTRPDSACLAPGERSVTLPVTVVDDIIDEPDEQFYVDLANAWSSDRPPGTPGITAQYPIAAARGTITILDDDLPPPPPPERLELFYDVQVDGGSVAARLDCPACSGQRTVRLERAGQIVASVTDAQATRDGTGTMRMGVRPQAGDVVVFVVGGVDRHTHTFDGRPTVDASCARVGKDSLSGRLSPGHTVREDLGATTAGDAFTLPTDTLRTGDVVYVVTTGMQSLAPSVQLTVTSSLNARVCGERTCLVQLTERRGGSAPLMQQSVRAAARHLQFFGARRLLAGTLKPAVYTCAKGRVEMTLKAGKVVVATGARTLNGAASAILRRGVSWRTTPAGRRFLRGKRRAVLRLTVRQTDSTGASAQRSGTVTVTASGSRAR